jgi:hypothetical protein
MKQCLGLALTATSATAVLLRGRDVIWSESASIADDASRRAAIQKLLAMAPRRRRTTLGVVVDSKYVQVRRLEGLPSVDERLQTRLVRQNAATFFLRREGGVVISDLHRNGDVVSGAAFDEEIVQEMVAVAGDLKLRLQGIAPGRADENEAGAARRGAEIGRNTPLAWTPVAGREPRRERVRLLVGVAMMLSTAMIALSAPVVREALDDRQMAKEIDASRTVEVEAMSTIAELRRVTQLLNERNAFEERRGRMIRLTDAVARALPESTALVSIRADSIDVSLVAVSRHVTDVVAALTTLADPPSVRLVGSVAHDVFDGVPLERAAFHFRQTPRITRR